MAKINDYNDCPKLLRDFIFYNQTIKGRSLRTVDGYYLDLRTFFRFINLHKSNKYLDIEFNKIPIENITIDIIKEITLSDVYEFLHFTSSVLKNSAITRSRKVSSIRSFFKYLTNKVNLLNNNPVEQLDIPGCKRSLPKYLTLEQCFELLKNVDGEFKERDYCIITLFINCGMRLSELVGINLSDITDNRIRLLGKGNKERIVYINSACISSINAYIKYRNCHLISPTYKNAFFLTRRGTRIGARRVEQIVDENLKLSGLENFGFSVHKLRHTAATIMYQNGGVDIRVLQQILGHENLGTTEIYTHTSSKQLEDASKSTPLANLKQPQKDK